MPSRKKTKGQARKAKVASASGDGASSTVVRGRMVNANVNCMHGLVGSQSPDVIRFMNTLGEDITRRVIGQSGSARLVVNSLQAASDKHPRVLDDIANRTEVIDTFVAGNAMLFLSDWNRDQGSIYAGTMALAVLLVENYTPSMSFEDILEEKLCRGEECKKVYDAINGCERSLIKFFLKRIHCNCLDSKYSEVKAQTPKTGLCHFCGERKKRTKLFVCQGCKITQYCSKRCHVSHWYAAGHKAFCIEVQKREKQGRLA